MKISGWMLWPYLISMLCFPIGLLLAWVQQPFDVGIPPIVPVVLLLVGFPSAVLHLVASFTSGQLTVMRRDHVGAQGQDASH